MIAFADGTSGADRYRGYINYTHSANAMEIGVNGSQVIEIDSSGRVGIGESSPSETLHVKGGSVCKLTLESTSSTGTSGVQFGDPQDDNVGRIQYEHNGNYMQFEVNAAEAMRIDSSQNLVLQGNLDMQDNDIIKIGTGDDLQIYHDGSASYIAADDLRITNQAVSETLAKFIANGAVELNHNDSKKLETKSDGIDVTGEVQCDSLDVDGVADFTGKVDVNNELHTHRTTTTASNALLALHSDIGGTKTRKVTVRADGSAEFAGIITAEAGAVAEIDALTDAATITPDLAASCNFSVTLGGNRTLANPSNITAGQSGSIFVTQDGTGSRTLAFGSYWDFAGGTAPTLTTTASAVDRIDYIVRSSTSIHAVATLAYS